MSFDKIVKRLEQVSILKAGTDPPVVGFCRVGYTLVGVQAGDFENITNQTERGVGVPLKVTVGGMPQMIIGGPKIRIGSYTDAFDRVMCRFGEISTPHKVTVGGMPQMVIGGPKIRIGEYL